MRQVNGLLLHRHAISCANNDDEAFCVAQIWVLISQLMDVGSHVCIAWVNGESIYILRLVTVRLIALEPALRVLFDVHAPNDTQDILVVVIKKRVVRYASVYQEIVIPRCCDC